jgi:hypothetical protein
MVCFFEFLNPFTLGGPNFLIFNQFSMTVSVLHVPRREVQVLWVNIKLTHFINNFFNVYLVHNVTFFYIYMILYKCFGGVYVYTSYTVNDGTYLQSILISCECILKFNFLFL